MELWDSFEQALKVCEKEQVDLLLIAGDLFHRQPLLRELKDVDYLFQNLSCTRVVFIAGNHDYLKPSSYYREFPWSKNVYPLLSPGLGCVEFPEIGVCVYGLSYDKREITERLYDDAFPEGRQSIEILLAHGGDEKHIPVSKEKLLALGYDYIALGHIHRPAKIAEDRICYSGSLEPTDKNDTGRHGYILGTIDKGKVKAVFVPSALRECIHMDVAVEKDMANLAVKKRVADMIEARGVQNIYKVTLTGFRQPEVLINTENMDQYGNILEIVDATEPAYDFEKLKKQNADNLLGKYIEYFEDSPEGSIGYEALFEGVRALLATKRGRP